MKTIRRIRGAWGWTTFLVLLVMAALSPCRAVSFAVSFWYPTNGEVFIAPADVGVHARVTDSNVVRTVQYYSGTTLIGTVTNTSGVLLTNSTQENPFFMAWSSVLAGAYVLTAVAADNTGNTATSAPVNITVSNAPTPVFHPATYIYSPTNDSMFLAPANLTIYARAFESGGQVATVQFFADNVSLGVVTNGSQMVFTNVSSEPLFTVAWSNVLAGSYALKVLATDTNGNTATSSVVNISVVTNFPAPVPHPSVAIYSPANGTKYIAPATVNIFARAVETNGVAASVQFFANSTYLGTVTNSSQVVVSNISSALLFPLTWSNAPAGNYYLKALATDTSGNTATSAVVSISIATNSPPPPVPFAVSFWYPTNGEMFAAPASIGVHARVTDSNVVQLVQYFSNGASIGSVSNTSGMRLTNSTQANPFFLDWTNVPVGNYTLTAVAADSAGSMATSGPVQIYVLTNLPPTVSIYAPDPVAIEGTNYANWFVPATSVTNYISGTNTATFLVRRDSDTNTDLTVYYSIGGTASNGVDYVTIPNYVVIPTGQRYALITIVPLSDDDSCYRHYDTVVLSLTVPTNDPTAYVIGSPSSAGAIILEENYLPIAEPMIRNLADNSMHVSLPATNGLNFCLQISTDLVNWLPVCTNTVLKGSAQFVDPNPGSGLYYRIVPVAIPASY
jgi:hypothetical protein